MVRLLLGLVAFVLVSPSPAGEKPAITEARLRDAATRAIELTQRSQAVWHQKEATCVSCHHHILPVLVERAALERGIAFDAAIARTVAARTFGFLKDLDTIVQGTMYIDDIDEGWRLLATDAAGIPASASTAAIAQFLASSQRPDGGWMTMDARPPQSHGRITTSAVAARAVALYFPESLAEQKQAVQRRAREWFRKATPRTTEERAFHLLGLLWTGADEAERKAAAKRFQAEQRADGGWPQWAGLESDAYSTGQALFALHHASGLAVADPNYEKGLAYLLKTQQPDGSWLVETRMSIFANPSPDYFNAGFPHLRNQFISIMGTSWATLALLQALPAKAVRLAPPDMRPAGDARLFDAALNGTAADLKAALDAGLSPNAKTGHGTTALMLAARDPEKVKLLLARGADATARADSGVTALIVAARFRGNVESLRALLDAGAKPNPPKGVTVVNAASALVFASSNGDLAMVRAILDAGAAIEEPMQVLGNVETPPLRVATNRGDAAMVELLIRRGANPNRGNKENITPLHRAVMGNHIDVAKVLLANGAKVNHADDIGFTALHYAAVAPYDDAALTRALLGVGADRGAKDQKGRTPVELANLTKRPAVMRALAEDK